MEKTVLDLGYCVCPKCGYRKKRSLKVPCYLEVCPRCEHKLQEG